MNPFLKPVKAAMRLLFINKFWSASLIVLLAGAGTFVAFSQTTPPNIKAITLSQDPLYTSVAADKPTLTLALSTENAINTLLHRGRVYDVGTEYLGYFDAESCYIYNNSPTEVAATDPKYSDYKRFDRIGPAAGRKCNPLYGSLDGFSGNFMNFATTSSIDIVRMAFTGGDRWLDSDNDLTVLQRGFMPCYFWTLTRFGPYREGGKSLPKDGGNYLGAVPQAMRLAAKNFLSNDPNASPDAGSDIVVGNTENKIFFAVSTNPTTIIDWTGGIPDADMPAYVPPERGAAPRGCGASDYTQFYYLSSSYPRMDVYGNALETPPSRYGSGLSGTDRFFYTRVRVCLSQNGVLQDTRDYSFCTQQPNGYYKPTGSIQKYGEQARLAIFGYLLDDKNYGGTQGYRYGGVLRAAMKYVGAKTFDSQGIDNTPDGGNPKKEWDPNTGVFYPNPDGATLATDGVTNSGVINYLNKFGRTNNNQNYNEPGIYKSYDLVGELYNEALRYLQGFSAPNPLAIHGVFPYSTARYGNNNSYDKLSGFPAARTWIDPYGAPRSKTDDYSCVKANILTVGDIQSYEGAGLWARAPSTPQNLPDFKYWQGVTENFEKKGSGSSSVWPYPPLPTTYVDGQSQTQVISNPDNPFNDSPLMNNRGGDPNYVGQAYWARSQDIRGTGWSAELEKQRPGLRVRSFFADVNVGDQSTVTASGTATTDVFRRKQNPFFRAAKYGGYEADDSNPLNLPYNKFGNPFKNQDGTNNNNVWQDPANPGEAKTYLLTNEAKKTISGIDNMFSTAIGRVASNSFAKGTVSNKTVSADGLVYQAKFDTANWTGDVQATALTLTGTSTVSISTTPTWTVAAQLAARPASSPRNIVIGRIGTGSPPAPVASDFTWASLETVMKTHLKKLTPSSTADSDATGEDRVKYLKGDRSKEGATFRTRTQVLGDIVNSGIVYSGTPTLNITPSTDAYKSFSASNSGRTAAIFVGANDGMLHAFNATNGNELFGYIPSWMGPKLAALTASTYTSNPQAYVDATPAVAEAQVGAAGTAADWKTVLVGGTGAGGPGVYALDVTNPAAFDASKVLWEFTKRDDADMGYVVGSPKIIKVRTSAAGTVPATYRWFAVVASGVNNHLRYTDSFGSYFSTTGKPALFFLALDKPAGTAWTSVGASPNYYKLSVPMDTALSANNATGNAPGLINFQAILGPVGELAQIYMGDLHGKVWKLDFTTLATSTWTFDALSYYKYNAEAYPMYIAKTAGGAVQPISMAPLVVSAATSGGRRTAYVAFGTGKFLEQSDTRSTVQNSFYTLYDDGTTSATGGSEIPSRGRLMAGTATTSGALSTVSVPSFKWGRPTADTDTATRAGWYLDFPSTTAKSIASASIIGDKLLFGSLNPATTVVAGSCRGGGGGSGTTYNVNIDAGNGTFAESDVGLLGEAFTLETSTASSSSGTGRRTKNVTQLRVNMGSNGARVDEASKATITTVSGRLNWRHVNNYQDLKNPQ